MEWTFDPLEIKNAYFNLERLGAIARRYNVNQYGITNSPLQGFLPTDRLVAEWWMTSRRVETLLSTGHHPPIHAEERVEVPGEIYEWKADPAMRAKAVADAGAQSRTVAGGIFPWACRVSAMSAMPMETAAFNSVAGTKIGRMLQIRSRRQDT